MNGDEFNIVLEKLMAEDEGAWSSIHSHIGIMISSMARKEKIELEWIASEDGMLDGMSVQLKVYSRLRKELISKWIVIERFADYKAVVSKYSKEILVDQFPRFYQLLRDKNDPAWKRVNERLYIYAAKWLSERNINTELASDIFQESTMTFFEKVTGRELSFETSRELKSYFFRILELKAKESNRKMLGHSRKFSESDWGHLHKPIAEEGFELDDKYFYIEKIMINTISKDELHILKRYYFHGDKLKSIAKSLQISDLNCRQKKHQALRKIAAIYRSLESGKMKHKPNKCV